jgi:hypothetical protein
MRPAIAPVAVLAGLVLAGCAALPASPGLGAPAAAAAAAPPAVPDFGPDGRVRRDPVTAAPVYLARASALADRSPRFAADGRVSRDPGTGAPLFEVVERGVVRRVLVAVP